MRVNQKKHFDLGHSKLALAGLIFLVSVLSFYASNAFYKKYQIKKEISILDKQIEDLREEGKEMEVLKNIMTDESFIEKEARIKLNFKKEGEEVVVLVEDPHSFSEEEEGSQNATSQNKNKKSKLGPRENFKKWIDFIFG